MINIKIKAFMLVASMTFIACEKVEDYEDVRTGKSFVTVNTTSGSAVEGSPVTFTLTVDKPLPVKMDYKLELFEAGSTATFRDFKTSGTESTIDEAGFGQGKIGYLIEFPAGATTYSFTVTPVKDLLVEGKEILKVRLSSSGNGRGLVAPGSDIFTVNISDFVSNDIGISLDWANITTRFGTIQSGTYLGLDNVTHDLSGYDADIDVTGDMGNSFLFETSVYPEVGGIDSSLSPMETYVIDVTLYLPAAAIRTKVPFKNVMKLTIGKYGTWMTVVDIPFDTATFTGPKFFPSVATIVKTGNTYVVTDSVGVVIASGRVNNASFPVKSTL